MKKLGASLLLVGALAVGAFSAPATASAVGNWPNSDQTVSAVGNWPNGGGSTNVN